VVTGRLSKFIETPQAPSSVTMPVMPHVIMVAAKLVEVWFALNALHVVGGGIKVQPGFKGVTV
jgi:hypothetical protein